MEKAYKFRVYPTSEQASQIQRTFGCCRYVYNHFLSRRKNVYEETGNTLNYVACATELTKLKKELVWLREADATALQSSLRALDLAYQGFFRRVKKGEAPGYPRYKSRKHHHRSYTARRVDNNISVRDNCVKLPKLGLVRAVFSTPVKGRILSATVSQSPSGKYFVSLCCTDVGIEKYASTGAVVGIDLGLKTAVITSDGMSFANHRYLHQSEKKLRREQRKLSRKSIGSRNRDKQRIKVALVHEKIANQRTNALHHITTQLVRDHDVICLEDLAVGNLIRNRRLAKAITDVSWGELKRQLEYKSKWHGRKLQLVGRFYASSQICSECGYQYSDTKDLSVRHWQCASCGAEHDRDINAAKNVLSEGMRLLAAV